MDIITKMEEGYGHKFKLIILKCQLLPNSWDFLRLGAITCRPWHRYEQNLYLAYREIV
ncbi:hypothetical protein H6G76_31600 [Nostoc sp. FACHB-152]|uniref:hypothetical protein n=1 Tax=Nostoc sp. FACHB-152 TaxID=2692837 RepID=UPI0016821A97|nr:hypothetical protein [Nostoc sp. FACHB-152]MBD2451584.1 hypothetical protein [Nostoc sp. FACHB-152]